MLSVLPLFLKNFFLSGGKGNICRPRTFFPPSAPFNIIIKKPGGIKKRRGAPAGARRAAARRHRCGKTERLRLFCCFASPSAPKNGAARCRTPQAPLRKKRNVCAYSAVLPRLPPQRTAQRAAGSLCGGTALSGRQSGAPEIGRAALPAGSIPLSCNYNGGSRAFSREGDTKAAPANGRRPF